MGREQNGVEKMTGLMGKAISMAMIGPILVYQKLISPFLPAACRFQPTCSAYGLQAIRTHGPLRGGTMALWRIARCHPFGGSGFDPVPTASDEMSRAAVPEITPLPVDRQAPAPHSKNPSSSEN